MTSSQRKSHPVRRGRSRTGNPVQPVDPGIKAAIRVARAHRRRLTPDRERALAMAKAYRSTLVPRRKVGVDADPATAQGAEIFLSGLGEYRRLLDLEPWNVFLRKLWREVYHAVLPGFASMDHYERCDRTGRLRKNIGAYLRRRGFKFEP